MKRQDTAGDSSRHRRDKDSNHHTTAARHTEARHGSRRHSLKPPEALRSGSKRLHDY